MESRCSGIMTTKFFSIMNDRNRKEKHVEGNRLTKYHVRHKIDVQFEL
jgi:hypothetical protein